MSATRRVKDRATEIVVITGLSGSGKGTVLRAFEDLGYYSVDNLPVDLIPKFADLTKRAVETHRSALVVDAREGSALDRFPAVYRALAAKVTARLLFLEADDESLKRRFSETRRPHPMGLSGVGASIAAERKRLAPVRALADVTINTAGLTVHQLRHMIERQFGESHASSPLAVSVMSFGFRHGVPTDADLVFDVRFLPNPNYVPELRAKTGRHPAVARFIRSYPQTGEFIERVSELLRYLLPHYIAEGKRYLTVAFGCTGGHHRSVMIADDVRSRLVKAGYSVRGSHRDIKKAY